VDGCIRAFVATRWRGGPSHAKSAQVRETQCAESAIDSIATRAAIRAGIIKDHIKQAMRALSISVPWPGTCDPTPSRICRAYMQTQGSESSWLDGVPMRWASAEPGHPALVARFGAVGDGSIDDPRTGTMLLRCGKYGEGEEFAAVPPSSVSGGASSIRIARWSRNVEVKVVLAATG